MGVNIGFYVLQTNKVIPEKTVIEHFILSKYTMEKKHYHTLFTYSLAHGNINHLISNMLPLFFFGKSLEMYFGAKTLL